MDGPVLRRTRRGDREAGEDLQLVLDEPLVCDRLEAVEDDDDEVAGPRGGDDLPPSPLAVFGALDDSGEIKQLDLGP